MKKLVLLFALLGVISLNVNAQSCPYANKANSEKVAANLVSADEAAAVDANIQKRVCQKSGTVSYVRKNVCSTSGKVSYADVEYCTKSGKFVNVSPKDADGMGMSAQTVATGSGNGATVKKGCCASGAKASCSKSAAKGAGASASATTVSGSGSTTAKKACCAKGKSCTKAAKASNTMAPAKTKLVKGE